MFEIRYYAWINLVLVLQESCKSLVVRAKNDNSDRDCRMLVLFPAIMDN